MLLVAVTAIINLRLRHFTYDAIQDTLRFYDNRLDIELDQDIMFLVDSCSSDPDIIRLRTTMNRNEEVGCIVRIQNRLLSQVTTHAVIRGFYLYYPEKDIFLPAYSTAGTGTGSVYPYPSFIEELIKSHLKEGNADKELMRNWFFIEEHDCLIRLLRVGGTYVGAWIDLNNLPGFDEFSGNDAIWMITDSSGRVLYADKSLAEEGYEKDYHKDLLLPVEKSLKKPLYAAIPGIGKRL
ncbi:MAG: hypothetical protein J6T50_03075, partial [Lachnospiraceae bacterium]|nr:hypothetical protein [Lachnospiraceae bacterium]